MGVGVCVCMCVCVCVREREREGGVYVCGYERERECVCVCVCVCEKDREYNIQLYTTLLSLCREFATWFIIYIKRSDFLCFYRVNTHSKYSVLLLILEVIMMFMSLDLLCD